MSEELHALCTEAARLALRLGIARHISYIDEKELIAGTKIPRVTIEWVDEAETYYDLEC